MNLYTLSSEEKHLFKQHLKSWYVSDEKILDLFLQIPRTLFVPNRYAPFAMADIAIPLSQEHEILPAKEIARLLQTVSVKPTDTVLEIGTASGYVTSLLAKLAKQVESVDTKIDFTQKAAEKLASVGINNVTFLTGQALSGWEQPSNYDVIWINGALPRLPAVRHQLSIGGRLCAILGKKPVMQSVVIKRTDEDSWEKKVVFETETRPHAETNLPQNDPFIF